MAYGGTLMLHSHLLAADTASSMIRIIVPLIGLLVLSGILVAALALVRRRIHADHSAGAPRDFSLGDLRALHREGKLSAEEFERAKSKLVSSVTANLKKDKDTKPSTLVEEPFAEELKDV